MWFNEGVNRVVKSGPPEWLRDCLLAGLLLAATFVAYLPALQGGFIWDDDLYVTQNPLLSAPDGLKRIWFSLDSPSQYFPLTYTMFRFERALWGLSPAGYHLVNVLLHMTNALLVWQLLRRLGVPGAWLAAAIFALHPVQVESVAWITELKSVLSLFFFLLAVLAWVEFVEARSKPLWRWYGLALVFYALALCSKTTACTLPVALLLILWLKEKPIGSSRLIQILPFIIMGLGMGLLTMWWERYQQYTRGERFGLGFVERVLLAGHAAWFYAGKLVWPANLTFSYPRWTINAADPPAYGWLIAGGGLCAVIYYVRRFVGRSIETAVAFYLATLGPTLGFIMLATFRYSFVADHYQYIASIGLIALAASGLITLFRSWKVGTPLLKMAFGGGLLALLGILTWRQCGMYTDPETLWRTTIMRNPNSFLAYNNLGNVLRQKGRTEEALEHYEQALRIQPDYPEACNNVGAILLDLGKPIEAMKYFQESLRLNPRQAEANYNLGTALGQLNKNEEAAGYCERALQIEPDYVEAHNNLGSILFRLGRVSEAIGHFQKAIELKPDYAEPHYNLGLVSISTGRWEEAVQHLKRALALMPNSPQGHYKLGFALQAQCNFNAARTEYQRAIELSPSHLPAILGLARLLATCPDASVRDGNRAVELAQQAVQLSGGSQPDALDTLAAAYAEAGQFQQAIETARQALNFSSAQNNEPLAAAILIPAQALRSWFRLPRETVGSFQEI